MKRFWALLKARNLEFLRDRAALAWAFVFPLLVIVGCALAFSSPDTHIVKVGLSGDTDQLRQLAFTDQPYVEAVDYPQLERALNRVRHHQLDLVLEADGGLRYWVNPESSSSAAARDLLRAAHGDADLIEAQLSGRAVRYVDWVMPGVLAMNMMFGSLFGVGYVIVRYRQNGVLKRLQATPVSAIQFISAQLVSRLLIVVLVNALIFVGCDWWLDLVVLGSSFNLLAVAVLGGLSMVALGLMIACRTGSEELAGGMLNASTWPMLFLSQVWFSLDSAPDWMQRLSDLLPLTHIVVGAREVMIDGASLAEISDHLLWLAAMTALFMAVAARLFRWQKD